MMTLRRAAEPEAMTQYWVIGGEYTDTSFSRVAPGKSLERHGPFDSYKEAHKVWQARAWVTVDDAHTRFRVLEGTEEGPGAGPSLIEGTPPKE
ncbi:MAG TPA: DUF4170 domain-containing protein [Stellaceae bacterium]|nr:DUF4170 domain-containing protein [Stellaceae bacterium]